MATNIIQLYVTPQEQLYTQENGIVLQLFL